MVERGTSRVSWRACFGGFLWGCCLFFSQMVLVFVGKVVYPLGGWF